MYYIEKQKDFKKFANSNGVNSMVLHDYQKHHNGLIIPQSMTPNIFETTEKRGALMDVYSRLMMDRILYLSTGVMDEVTTIISAQLLWLDSVEKKDIQMMINSPGGSVYAGNTILDTMDFVKSDVATLNIGIAASMGAVILSNGTKGKRSSLPLARTMIHQISSGTQGTFSDMVIGMNVTESVRRDLYLILAENTEKTFEQIELDCERDKWLKADEARDYGLIDEVVKLRKERK
jgi:ATP-dependent Clp protease protease subunit